MTYSSLLNHLMALIASRVSDPAAVVPEARFDTDLHLDSLATVELLADIEDKFELTISDEELPRLTTVRQTANRLAELLEVEVGS